MGAALFAGLVIFGVMLAWVGVQALVRKSENLPPETDVIGDTDRACGHCHKRDACSTRPTDCDEPS